MSTKQECLRILRKYDARIRTHGKRKRGDCPRVINAAAILLGGKKCAGGCKDSTHIHLHHINGNWKNNNINNLMFLCRECHLEIHRGWWANKPMKPEEFFMMKRYRWTEELVNKLKKDVDNLVAQNKVTSKGDAFKAVGKIWNLKPLSVENVYYGRRGVGNKRKTTTKTVNITKSSMTADEAISFWQDMKRWGITVN